MAAALAVTGPAAAEEIACGANGAPAGAIELREAVVSFSALASGGEPTPYAAFLIPAGWAFEGAASIVGDEPCGVMEKARWRAASPDGAASVEMLPAEGWTASAHAAQFSVCQSRNVADAATYAAAIVKGLAPDAVLGEARERADIVEPFNEQLKGMSDYGARAQATAAELSFELAGADGVTEYGLLIAAVTTFTPEPVIPEYETRAMSFPSLLARSRGRTPDAGLIEMIRASALANPNWPALRADLFRPPGHQPDPRIRKVIRPPEPFPARETGPAVEACGKSFVALKTRHVWKGADGGFLYAPALTAALEKTP